MLPDPYDINQRIARTLYLDTDTSLNEIAQLASTDEATLNNWIIENGWNENKKSLLTSRKTQIKLLYKCLETLHDKVTSTPEVITRDVDLYLKYTAAIKNLQDEHSIGTNVEVFEPFVYWLRQYKHQAGHTFTPLVDIYLKEKMAEK